MTDLNGLKILLTLFMGFFLSLSTPSLAAGATEEVADVRVLIDISGSMKKNDPQNLRRPALRLLVGLMPENARAGVWTFGQYVNMQVPLGKVNRSWKRRARAGAAKIHSRGLFTNIEEVIKRASSDWSGSSGKYSRHLVLLTDGVVDVSKDPTKNPASRRRILEQQLPQLKALGARVHTIALSERADHELMQTLSRETGGWYEQVNKADQLQRVFLRIFEKVGKPDTVPLKDNRFRVDSTIQEVTLLIFKADDATPTTLITPGGKQFGIKDAPQTVSWHRDEGYDLLTISEPESGDWHVQAAMDPDNRVIVITDLKMEMTDLPNRAIQGERLASVIHFSNQKKKITRRDFLDVVNLASEYSGESGPGEPRPVYDDGQDPDNAVGDGDFTLAAVTDLPAGIFELVITAEGKTFQREKRHTFELAAPASLQVEESERGGKAGILVRLTPDMELLDGENIGIEAHLVSAEGESQQIMMLPGTSEGSWESWVDQTKLTGNWNLGVKLTATTASGNPLQLDLDPVLIEGRNEEPVATAPPAEVPEDEGESQKEEIDGMMLAAMFGGGNLILLLLGGVGYWMWQRRRDKDKLVLIDDEEIESPKNESAGSGATGDT